jgi:transcriptional regulator with XRE-family HTH domain
MVEDDPGPVVQRLIFGSRLRQLRVAAGFELEDANDALGWYRGKLSKIENGMLATKPKEVDAMLARYGVSGSIADEIRRLAADGRRSAAPERVADSARQYVALERAAAEIRMVYGEVPGMFQTTEFARAQLMCSPVVLGAQVNGWAEAREQRGERLRKPGAQPVLAVLGEAALYVEVGGRDVLRRQLERLHDFAVLPNVSIRLFPFAAGASPGLSCPFTLLFIEPAQVHIAYAETLTGADYIKTTSAYSVAFDQAHERALSEDDSREALVRRINDLK